MACVQYSNPALKKGRRSWLRELRMYMKDKECCTDYGKGKYFRRSESDGGVYLAADRFSGFYMP